MSAGLNDVFLAKFNSTGVLQWIQRFGGTSVDTANSVVADEAGNSYLGGLFAGTTNYGGGSLFNAGGYDIVLAKYNSAGVHQWSQRFGSSGDDAVTSVAVDATGNIAATGYFSGNVSVGGAAFASAGFADIFLAKYNSGGVHQWSQGFGGSDSDYGFAVEIDGTGNVLLTGSFVGTVNFGGSSLASAGYDDVFLPKFNPSGVHQWSQHFGGLDTDLGTGVAADADGNVLLAAQFIATVNFGGSSFPSAGSWDILVAKYAGNSAEPVIESIVDIGNDQGRRVKIRFARSGRDESTVANPVTRYVAFLRDDAPPAAAPSDDRVMRDDGWTEVGSVGAFAKDTYGIDVPTVGDSTEVAGQYYSTFFIRAMTGLPETHYDSKPDSGYSLDNLAPGVPEGLAFTAGQLTWSESPAQDFDFFTVYGASADLLRLATVVEYSTSPTMDVSASPYTFYFVTATDVSGNEGEPARVEALSGAVGVPGSYILSVSNYPNPFNPRTTVSYTLPSRGAVSVVIYDARGARIRTLVNDPDHAAGAHTIEWNGRADNGAPVSSGIYFARIEHGGASRSKKMVVLK